MINLADVFNILSELGGNGAVDEFSKGYDEAIDLIESEVCKLPSVELTHDDVCLIAVAIGGLYNSNIIDDETLANLMVKIRKMNMMVKK